MSLRRITTNMLGYRASSRGPASLLLRRCITENES
jgi:hypothetical protein